MPMKRVWEHVLTGAVMLSGLAVVGSVVSACVHNDSTIFVSHVVAPQLVTPGQTCLYQPDPTAPFISSGLLDADLSATYSAVFLIGNQLVPRGDPNQPNTETNYVTLQGAVVRVVASDGTQLNTFTRLTSVTLPPSSGTTPGYGVTGVTIVDQPSVVALSTQADGAAAPTGGTQRVVSYVRFFGKTLGGDSVESDEFGFPVDICHSCLITFPPAEENKSLPTPNCANAAAASSTTTSVPCVIGQDLPVDCANCQAFPACQ
jgi:hypothetical protein